MEKKENSLPSPLNLNERGFKEITLHAGFLSGVIGKTQWIHAWITLAGMFKTSMFASTVGQASILKLCDKYSVMYYERMHAMDAERYNWFWGAFWAHFSCTSTHQATYMFGGRAPVGQPWYVFTSLLSTRVKDACLGTNRIYLSIRLKEAVPPCVCSWMC